MQKEDDGLRSVDRGTAADRNDDIGARLFERICAGANSGNGGVLPNVVESGRIAILLTQDTFHFLHNIRLRCMKEEGPRRGVVVVRQTFV